MRASESDLLKFLNGTKQFHIPIYQRSYSWTIKQCEQLLEDIIKVSSAQDTQGHFIGSIVYIERGFYHVSSINSLLIIDGQQRLATLSLIILALSMALEERGITKEVTTKQRLKNYYLINNEEEGDTRLKLVLSKHDKDIFNSLIEEKELPDNKNHRLIDNFKFFTEEIKKIELESIYQGLKQLFIIDVSLDRERDNPQLIFESLNSTGLELTQADLIRNYLLMGLERKQQEKFYKDYWFAMEENFGYEGYTNHFDKFMRNYLTIKTNKIPNIRAVYEEFKLYHRNSNFSSIEELLKDIYKFSKFYARIALNKEKDRDLNTRFQDIKALKVEVAYPFLLCVFEDFNQEKLSKDQFLEILDLIESYVFRRSICEIPTNSLNKIFSILYSDINQLRQSVNDTKEFNTCLKAKLIFQKSYRRFPTDNEFSRSLMVKDVYNFRNRNFLLRKLENFKRKEPISVENYTIEHILPQNENLSTKWRKELGSNWKDIQSRLIHTLGNLTLTGYNPELSDKYFLDKRNMIGGFSDSPLYLNHSLAKLEMWNEENLNKRASKLAKRAIKIWSYPVIDEKTLITYETEERNAKINTFTIKDHKHLKGNVKLLFDELKKRIMNLDSSITEEVRKNYIAYKKFTNFVYINPRKSYLKISLNIPFNELDDPNGICVDKTREYQWGDGDIRVDFRTIDEIDYVMFLIEQAYRNKSED